MVFSKCLRFVIAAAFLAVFVPLAVCRGCMTIYQSTPTPQDYVASEQAIIIWDEQHHIEHFIREANLHTDSTDIGFLVPTPNKPEIALADSNLFSIVQHMGTGQAAPTDLRTPWGAISPIVTNPLLHLGGVPSMLDVFSKPNSSSTNSALLGEGQVSDYHATILAADDESGLYRWLNTNGYLATPEMRAWLRRYSQAHWTITAFKLTKSEDRRAISTSAIRMSFSTDKPFYPYSEPSDRQLANAASPNGRALSVTILSSQRMAGSLADQSPWPGRLEYAGSSSPPTTISDTKTNWTNESWAKFADFDQSAGSVAIPSVATTMIDESNPRPGTADLYFLPDTNQSPYATDIVNVDAPSNVRFAIGNPLKDITAVILVFLLPAVPLYCGWQVLKIPPEPNGSSPRIASTMSLMTPFHPIVGALAVLIGLYYAAQFAVILAEYLAAPIVGWSSPNAVWFWTFLALFIATLPIACMVCGVVFCGITVSGSQMPRSGIFHAEGFRHAFLSVSALVAGLVLFFAMLGAIVPLI